jgi:hypothetical protein
MTDWPQQKYLLESNYSLNELLKHSCGYGSKSHYKVSLHYPHPFLLLSFASLLLLHGNTHKIFEMTRFLDW